MSLAIKNYFDLCRVSNLPTVWTNVLAALVLTGTLFSFSDFLTLAISMSLFYSGGMCFNDICDEAIDKIKKPSRPIPSGRVSIKGAYALAIVLFVIALFLLLLVTHQKALYTGIFLLTMIITYDKFHKDLPLSVILMAACRFMIFVIASIAVAGTVGEFVAMAGAFQFVYVLVVSIAARHENNRKEQDSSSIIPIMIAFISLLDGIVMAIFSSPAWLLAGICGSIMTLTGQKYIRGD
jgi:4-hydroxybenzoate polyprenyltransferase